MAATTTPASVVHAEIVMALVAVGDVASDSKSGSKDLLRTGAVLFLAAVCRNAAVGVAVAVTQVGVPAWEAQWSQNSVGVLGHV